MAIVKFLTKSGLTPHGESVFTSSESYQADLKGSTFSKGGYLEDRQDFFRALVGEEQ